MSSVGSLLTQFQTETNRARFEQGQQALGTSELGNEAFLQLLLAQLQNQDPLDPLDDTEFISQQAQFTQIEKLDNLSKALERGNQISQASSLVGKTVQISVADEVTGQPRLESGQVTSVAVTSEGVGLIVDGTAYSMDTVVQIYADGYGPDTGGDEGGDEGG